MYLAKLLSKKEVAIGTMLFRFTKPENFSYIAGQSIDLFIPNPRETDEKGNKRAYTLASAPYEEDLYIATRMRDTAFKRLLKEMEIGGELELDGPFGDLTLHESIKRLAVFLAGGIGITPFHSIALDAAKNQLPHKITLFYSNRRPEDSVFLSELEDLQKENQNYKLVATMTDMENSKEEWSGERGCIDTAMVNKYVSLKDEPIFYLAGPNKMVKAMRILLNNMKVSNDDIKVEEFTGY